MNRPSIFRCALLVITLPFIAVQWATAETYTVNTSSDNVVANACANHQANCSLRGAILAANANPGSTIVFSIVEFCGPSGCAITLQSALPDISVPMSISGPTQHVIQRGSSASTNFRIFDVTTNGTVNFTSLTIAKGMLLGESGAGIQNHFAGTVNVTNCVLRDNTSGGGFPGFGGGIFNNSTGTVNVSNSIFANNHAGNGGGLGAVAGSGSGSIIVSGCTFSGNTAIGGSGAQGGDSGSEGRGGAIFTAGNADISNSTFVGNSATGGTGFSAPGGAGRGGAVFASSGNLKLSNCTISGNSTSGGNGMPAGPSSGGGIETITATATIKSSIVALNSASSGPDVNGSFTSAGFNLIGKIDGGTGFTAATDLTGTVAAPLDPKLDPSGLQNNGGPTQTIALPLGSPAIDKGSSSGLGVNLITDQRGAGFPRVFDDSAVGNAASGDGADIGAFELQSGQSTKLANIATRLAVQTGDNVLIGGFIITGTQPKKVLLRAIGPSLNLPGKLANPTLELFTGSTLLASNDDWQNQPAADRQAVIDSAIPPSNDLESALVRTLAANGTGYTAIVRGLNNGTGIALVEAYDLDLISDSKLANISTRGFVQTGDNVLIAGTIILGNTAQRVIIRAIGPSLPFGGTLSDPTLQLFDGNATLLEESDNWVDSPNKQAIIDSGLAPGDNRESVILRTIPGNAAQYTAIVRGVNNAIGIAVVEVYALP